MGDGVEEGGGGEGINTRDWMAGRGSQDATATLDDASSGWIVTACNA